MAIVDSQFETARVYHDFNSLSQLKNKGKDDNPEAIREAAKQFESVFMRMMLKSMRDANAAIIDEPLFDSNQLDLYKDMYDEQLSLHLSSSGPGLGLTDILVQQLSGHSTQSKQPDNAQDFNPVRISRAQPATIKPQIQSVHSEINIDKELVEKINLTRKEEISTTTLSPVNVVSPAIAVTEAANERGPDFSTPVAFVQSLWRHAREAANKLQMDPKVLMAQAALETGWGKYVMRTRQGKSSKNLFGIKAGQNWEGNKIQFNSLELQNGTLSKQKSAFRVYESYAESFNDYARFIGNQIRYQKARNATDNPQHYMHELQTAGYATDPDYAKKIGNIYNSPIMNDAIRTLTD